MPNMCQKQLNAGNIEVNKNRHCLWSHGTHSLLGKTDVNQIITEMCDYCEKCRFLKSYIVL